MFRLITTLLIVATLSGCNQAAPFDGLTPTEESSLAQVLVAKVVARDYAAIESALDPSFRSPNLHAQLEAMVNVVPTGSLKSVKVVGSKTVTNSKGTNYDLTLEYEYQTSWLLAGVVMHRSDGKIVLQGINFVPRDKSLESENRFTFEGKGPAHYLVLVLAIAVPLFILYSLVLCIRTRFPKRKWLWVLFVAVGLAQFHFNWASGAWSVESPRNP